MTTQIEVSATLTALVDEFIDAVVKTRELVERIRRQAEEDGLSEKELDELIKAAGEKRGLSTRQVSKYRKQLGLINEEHSQKIQKGREKVAKTKYELSSHQGEKTTKSEKTTVPPDTQMQPPVPTFTKAEEPYRGDAGNDPALLKKYTQEETTTIVIDAASWLAGIYSARLPRGTMARVTYENATGKFLEIKKI